MMKINRASVFYTTMILGISNILLQLIGFVYRMFLTEMVGTEGLGIYKLTMQVYSILLTVCTAGVCLVATNKSASLYSKGDRAGIRKMIKSCIIIFLVSLLICGSLLIIFKNQVAVYILGDIQSISALYIIVVCILLTGIENIIKSSLIGIKKVKYTAISEIIEQILRIGLVLFLIYNYADGDYKKASFLIILGMTLSEIFSIIFLGIVYEKTYKTEKKSNEKMLINIAKIALPISFAGILNNIISSASTIALPSRLQLAGFTNTEALQELGIISGIAMPILMLPIAVISSYSMVIMPSISKNKSLGNEYDIVRKINKSFEATGYIGICGTIVFAYFSIPLGRMFFDIEFSNLYIIMLAIATVFLYYQIVSASILNGLGLEKKAIFHSVFGEFIQLLLTIILCSIPKINIYGYLFSMIASPVIVSILNMIFIFDRYKFRAKKFIIRPLFASLFIFLSLKTSYEFYFRIINNEFLVLILTMISVFFVYMLILRAFGINYVKYLSNLNTKESRRNLIKDFIF